MKILNAATENFIKGERTFLTADVAAGAGVSIPVDNTQGFNANDYIVIGREGNDTAELVQITAVVDATHITATLTLAHSDNDPIVVYRYNKRKFYGSTTSGGTYIELTTYGSPITIDVDNPLGTILEYTGAEGYLYFKATYYNSTTTEESALSEAAEALADESVRYCGLYDIRKQAGLTKNPYVDDGRIEGKRKQAENEVNSYLIGRYVLPLENSSNVSEIPYLLTHCTILLAAGYLDYEEFGSDGQGVKWLGEARGILTGIQKGTQRLIDSSGGEFQSQTQTQKIRSGTTSWPNFRRFMKF